MFKTDKLLRILDGLVLQPQHRSKCAFYSDYDEMSIITDNVHFYKIKKLIPNVVFIRKEIDISLAHRLISRR